MKRPCFVERRNEVFFVFFWSCPSSFPSSKKEIKSTSSASIKFIFSLFSSFLKEIWEINEKETPSSPSSFFPSFLLNLEKKNGKGERIEKSAPGEDEGKMRGHLLFQQNKFILSLTKSFSVC